MRGKHSFVRGKRRLVSEKHGLVREKHSFVGEKLRLVREKHSFGDENRRLVSGNWGFHFGERCLLLLISPAAFPKRREAKINQLLKGEISL